MLNLKAAVLTPLYWFHPAGLAGRFQTPLPLLERRSVPVWPSGKALGCKRKDLGSIPLRLSFLFETFVVCGHCHVTLSTTPY